MVDVAPILGQFLARPPTPPKESTGKLSNDTAFLNAAITTRSLLDTPEESPSSSAEYFKGSSGKAQKRVGFSGWTQYHRPTPLGSKGYDSDEQRRRVPPSRECNPTKSILKPYIDISSVESKDNLLFDQSSLPSMLRSAALHLASDSRSSKIDAYTSLLGCLSAYDDVPDPQELAEKVGEIAGAIRKDVVAKNGDGMPDAQLASQALKLVTILLCTKGTMHLLPEEFCSFIFEQSLMCMEDPTSPKMLVSHHMHLVEKQKFSAKILTNDRINRLLLALSAITTHVRGNRVVCHRLNIYQRLVTQAKPLMISRVGSWIDHLVAGMLSTIKDIRARAIAFGLEAGLQLGTTSSVSQECINVFDRQGADGTMVVNFLSSRLTEMTKSKEDGVHVPQIWSVVLLLLRSRPHQIERWEHLRAWLVIVQQCFNSNDAQIKFQANLAWNRLIFALDISTSTTVSMAKMLKQPIVSQLERKLNEKNAKQAKQIARSSYCTLLYYAFRPSATHAQLDQYWDLYVADILPKTFAGSSGDIDYACDVLAALLFNNSLQAKIWDSNKANTNAPIKPEDIPSIDPKWIRSKTQRVLETFEKLFRLADWNFNVGPNERLASHAPVALAWQSFMSALGHASSKEVKVSMDTMTAVAKIVDRLKRFLNESGPNNPVDSGNLFKFDVLLEAAVAKIGCIPFNEKRLLLTHNNAFEAAAETPSSRGSFKSASLDSAAIHLINILLLVENGHESVALENTILNVVHVTLQNATSRQSRLKTLRSLARHILPENISKPSKAVLLFWGALSSEMTAALKMSRTSEKHNDSPEYPGHEYRDVVKVLELGVHLRSDTIVDSWVGLYDRLCLTLSTEIGSIGILLVVQEPLSETLRTETLQQCDHILINYVIALLKSVHLPMNSKIIEHAQLQLWGVIPMQHRSDPMDLLKPIQRLTNTLLQETYASAESMGDGVIGSVISATMAVMTICPGYNRIRFVEQIQKGVAMWIEDVGTLLAEPSDTFFKVSEMYQIVGTSLESAPKFDSDALVKLQDLITSCLRSRHKSILNQSVLMWNRTFGRLDTLDYPEELQKILPKLRAATDIQLPDYPDIEDSQATSSPLRFVESQDSDDDALQVPNVTPYKRYLAEERSPGFFTPTKRLSTNSPNPASASREAGRPHSARRDVKTTPKARLRHDDSQIQFAPIESSPMAVDDVELQMLTDRQKEVKERQEHEAALFPEIRSSPRGPPNAAEYRLPKLVFKSSEVPNEVRVDEDTSPSFPPDAMMNDFLGSSPTPSSSRKRSEEPFSDDGPPSSPPMVSSHLDIRRTLASPRHPHEVVDDAAPVESQEDADEPMAEASPVLPPMNAAKNNTANLRAISDGKLDTTVRADIETNPMSELDIYVDAPAEPSRDLSVDHQAGGPTATAPTAADKNATQESAVIEQSDVSHITESFQVERSSHATAEDDEVTAQLVNEMAMASSKLVHQLPASEHQGAEPTKKRKARSAAEPRKRRKSLAPKDGATLEPSSGEVVADCVLIEARPASNTAATIGPVIKTERSASPSPLTSTSNAPDETPATGKRAGRPTNAARKSPTVIKEKGPRRHDANKPRVKAEPGSHRRTSGRLTRISSRLSDGVTGSPNRSEASFASQDLADSEPIPWTYGPHGSRWSYVPASAPADHAPTPQPDRDPMPEEAADPRSEEAASPEPEDNARPAAPIPQPEAAEVPAEAADESATAGGILQGFRNLLEHIKAVRLRPEEERSMVGILFESVQQVHEAGRRHHQNGT